VQVSILGLGGHHQARPKEESESFRLVHAAIDNGITFMDNAWDYHDGRAEEVMGKALAMDGYRKKAFLMTKVCDRDYAGAMKHLEDSLRRLRTDVIDLWQFHECNYYNDPEFLTEKGGLKAALEAKKQGKVRFIGFTGHKHPRIHRKMLALNFAFDACQMPNNVMDYRFESFRHEVMPECAKRGVGVIGMKGCGGDARMLKDGVVTVFPVTTHQHTGSWSGQYGRPQSRFGNRTQLQTDDCPGVANPQRKIERRSRRWQVRTLQDDTTLRCSTPSQAAWLFGIA
jgi:predicted aldo/keto reductase-like oxidoreductase